MPSRSIDHLSLLILGGTLCGVIPRGFSLIFMKARKATRTAPVMEDMLIIPKPPIKAASNVSEGATTQLQ